MACSDRLQVTCRQQQVCRLTSRLLLLHLRLRLLDLRRRRWLGLGLRSGTEQRR